MTRMLARRSSARAMHSSCRSPAERLPPASATPASSPPSWRTLVRVRVRVRVWVRVRVRVRVWVWVWVWVWVRVRARVRARVSGWGCSWGSGSGSGELHLVGHKRHACTQPIVHLYGAARVGGELGLLTPREVRRLLLYL